MEDYEPEDFWEERLSSNFNLRGVGHKGFSQFYNKFLYSAKSKQLEKVIESSNLDTENLEILDLGSGTGFFIDYYESLNPQTIVGIDITQKTVEELKERYPKYTFKKQDIGRKFNLDKKFDIINVFDVLYHITDEDKFETAFENISRHLKNGGLAFISDSYRNDPAEHVKFRGKNYREFISDRENLELVNEVPLYFLLNKRIFSSFPLLGRIDNFLAPIYYRLDQKIMNKNRSNMQIYIIRKKTD